jgi:thiol:disulfide interchange protein
MTTQGEKTGLPFGAVFGALFFALFAVWLLAGSPAGQLPIAPRASLVLASSALAVALAASRLWSRWGGAVGAIAVAVIVLRLGALDFGPTALVVVLGAVLATALLLVPATGDLGRAREPAPPVGRGARGSVLAATTCLGAIGFALSMWLAGDSGLAAGGSAAGTPSTSAASRTAADRVPWTDFGAALARAQAESKPILATFVTAWCGYCRQMDRTTWRDARVIDRVGGLVAARVDAEDTDERNGYSGRGLAERYGVQGYPTLVVLDSSGRVVARTSGYLPSEDLLDWLDQVLGRERSERLASSIPTS